MSETAAAFPVDSLRDAALELRRPFEVKAIKWKVQNAIGAKDNPSGGMVVCYMDRGLVIDRLNMVIPHLWSMQFSELERGHMLCKLTVDGVTREDVGEGGTLKARYSDSLKRVAVHFGVGASLSRVPKSKLTVSDKRAKIWTGHDGKKHVDITQAGLDYLRARYETWLADVGIAAFGEPLLHGDLGDAQGDDEVADESIIDDSSAVDLYVSLSEVGLLPRQQVGLVNQSGGHIAAGASAEQIQAAVGTLTEEQAAELERLIVERMEANDRENARRGSANG
ncbi:MAG: Rad52/22 double-strand break repair protein [Solirubrobacterales bacterium]|nr:Rad52/22 double-strand break repair protein [Solirubrobacterales bacterium]